MRVPLGLMLASAAILATVFVFQFGLGLAPCELCVLQRWPHAVAIVLAGAAVRFWRARRGLLWLLVVAYLAGAGIAGFHVGVEHHWWAGTNACGLTSSADGVAALKAQLLKTPVARCDEVAWSLLGISMAGYNLSLSLGLGAVAALAATRKGYKIHEL